MYDDGERWEYIDEFPDYQISNYGYILNLKTDMPRRTSVNANGVVNLSLYLDGRLTSRSLAVLVAKAFVDGYSDVYNTVIHLDGNRNNCRADNLMWRPRWYAIYYHKQFEYPAFQTVNFPVMETTLQEVFPNPQTAALAYGIHFIDVIRSCDRELPVPITMQQFVYA